MRWGTEKQIIKALEARLQWFMNEAAPEEFDSEEITAIVDLLEIMDPIERREGEFYKADKAHARYWTFYASRQSAEEDEPSYPLSIRIEMKLHHLFRSSAFVNASFIAALVVAMILGGTTVVYGQRNGFFSTIESGKNMTITSPDGVNSDTVFRQEYESMEQVPIQYLNYVWAPNSDMQLMELQRIELVCDSKFVKVECFFEKEGSDLFVSYIKKSYQDTITTIDQLFDSYDLYGKEIIEGIEVGFYEKANEDYAEYIVAFNYEKSRYYVYSNLDIDTIKEIVYDSIANSIL